MLIKKKLFLTQIYFLSFYLNTLKVALRKKPTAGDHESKLKGVDANSCFKNSKITLKKVFHKKISLGSNNILI